MAFAARRLHGGVGCGAGAATGPSSRQSPATQRHLGGNAGTIHHFGSQSSAAKASPGFGKLHFPLFPAHSAQPPPIAPSATSSAAPAPLGSPLPSRRASGSLSSAAPAGSDSPEETPRSEARSPLAGREAGEGRLRPGRQLSPQELAHADNTFQRSASPSATTDPEPVPAAPPAASTSPGADGLSPQALDAPTVRRVKQVSLGAGIALIGMGLGFLAFRMRRAD